MMPYMGGEKRITLEDVRAACGEAGDQSIDDLLYAIGSGKTESASRLQQADRGGGEYRHYPALPTGAFQDGCIIPSL